MSARLSDAGYFDIRAVWWNGRKLRQPRIHTNARYESEARRLLAKSARDEPEAQFILVRRDPAERIIG